VPETAISVREAEPEDAPGIAVVHISSWQVAYAHIFPADALRGLADLEDRRATFWRETIASPSARSHTLVAVADAGVVGFAHTRPTRDEDADAKRVGELTAIYVSPDQWGSGAGRLLMTAVVERLRRSGFAEAMLWVLEENPRARRFYERAGWHPDGGVKEDEFLGTRVSEIRYRTALA
jgi:GNAT superfamily N-acetyltransferase